MANINPRFVEVYRQNTSPYQSIFIDTATGVNYLMVRLYTDGVSVTPLLGVDGKPLITPYNPNRR